MTLALLVNATVAAAAPQDPPSSMVSAAPSPPRGLFAEPRIITRAIDVASRTIGGGGSDKNGFFLETSHMVTGAGWIAVGPGYRRWFMGDRAVLEMSAGWSWRSYKMAQARFEFTNLLRSRLAVGTQVRWQDLTQITWFGAGPDAPVDQRSEYRLTSRDIVGYATVRPLRRVGITVAAGWLDSPEIREPAGTFQRGYRATADMFSDDPVFVRGAQPRYLHGDASILADTRDHRGHPTAGGIYRAAAATYLDRDGGAFSFQRFELEAARFQRLAGGPVVLALHWWLVGSRAAESATLPIYLMPSLGGANTLRSFANYRFHDRQAQLAQVESRVELTAHIDAAVFFDAGDVSPRLSGLGLAKRSVGAGLRVHSGRSTFARLDVAHGREGWRVFFRVSDPFHFGRLSRRMAMLPFVP